MGGPGAEKSRLRVASVKRAVVCTHDPRALAVGKWKLRSSLRLRLRGVEGTVVHGGELHYEVPSQSFPAGGRGNGSLSVDTVCVCPGRLSTKTTGHLHYLVL